MDRKPTAPPGTLERRIEILEAAVGVLMAQAGGPEAMGLALEDGPWPAPPPPPPPPGDGEGSEPTNGG